MVLDDSVRCPTCGQANEGYASACALCGMQLGDESIGPQAPAFIQAIPPWLRWIIALPMCCVAGAVVGTQIEFLAFRDFSGGLLYAAAGALTIYAASNAAAYAAPWHRKQVGYVVALADFSVVIGAYLWVMLEDPSLRQLDPAWVSVANIVLPSIGTIAAVFAVSMNRSLGADRYFQGIPATLPLGLRWASSIALPLLVAGTFGAVALGVSRLLPAFFAPGPSNDLAWIVGAAIVVTVAGDYAPSKGALVAWLFAGALCALSVKAIVLSLIELVRFWPLPGLGIYEYILVHAMFVAIGSIGAVAIGLTATYDGIRRSQRAT